MRVRRQSLRCSVHKKLVAKPACLRTSSYCPTVKIGGLRNYFGVQGIGWVPGCDGHCEEFDEGPVCFLRWRRLSVSNWRPGRLCGFRVSPVGSIPGTGVRVRLIHQSVNSFFSGRATVQIPIKMQFLFTVLAFFLQPHDAFSLPSPNLINPSLSLTQNTAISNLSKPT